MFLLVLLYLLHLPQPSLSSPFPASFHTPHPFISRYLHFSQHPHPSIFPSSIPLFLSLLTSPPPAYSFFILLSIPSHPSFLPFILLYLNFPTSLPFIFFPPFTYLFVSSFYHNRCTLPSSSPASSHTSLPFHLLLSSVSLASLLINHPCSLFSSIYFISYRILSFFFPLVSIPSHLIFSSPVIFSFLNILIFQFFLSSMSLLVLLFPPPLLTYLPHVYFPHPSLSFHLHF